MNGTVSRRVFVGRTALGLGGAAVGGSAVAISFADLGGQSVNSLGAVGEEIDRQLAEGIRKDERRLGRRGSAGGHVRAALRLHDRQRPAPSRPQKGEPTYRRARRCIQSERAGATRSKARASTRRGLRRTHSTAWATRRRSIVSVGRACRRPCASGRLRRRGRRDSSTISRSGPEARSCSRSPCVSQYRSRWTAATATTSRQATRTRRC